MITPTPDAAHDYRDCFDRYVRCRRPERIRSQATLGPERGLNHVQLLWTSGQDIRFEELAQDIIQHCGLHVSVEQLLSELDLAGRHYPRVGQTLGEDLGVGVAAWTSTSYHVSAVRAARLGPFLDDLLRRGHSTPFERQCLRWRVLVDDATHIHILKHRIGTSVNGQSARYAELRDDNCYCPPDWPQETRAAFLAEMEGVYARYHQLRLDLEAQGFSKARAKETARYILPKANQIYLDIQLNFQSFLHMLTKRDTHHAQREVREVVERMMDTVDAADVFPLAMAVARAYLHLVGKEMDARETINLCDPRIMDIERVEYVYRRYSAEDQAFLDTLASVGVATPGVTGGGAVGDAGCGDGA